MRNMFHGSLGYNIIFYLYYLYIYFITMIIIVKSLDLTHFYEMEL